MATYPNLGQQVQDETEAELRAQHASLRQQVPLMYLIMAVNSAFLSAVTIGNVPTIISLGMPAVLLAITGVRAALWGLRRHAVFTTAQIRQHLRGTMIAAAVLSLMFGGWGLWLFSQIDAPHGSAIALYVVVGSIGCCYCLQALPGAARLVLLFGGAPVTVRMLLSGDWYLIGIGTTFTLVAILILQTLATTRTAFLELLRSRSEMSALVSALQHSEQHYRHSIELNPQIPWVADPSGAIIELSPRWSTYTGVPIDLGHGSGWMDAVHPDDLRGLNEAWGKALAEGEGAVANVRYRLRQRDGSFRWFRAQANPLRDQTGQIVRWYGNLEDIDDQVAAEGALRESEERYRLASRATKDIIWDWSPATGRIQWAGEVDAIFGYEDAAQGTSIDWWMERVHPDDLADVLELYERVLTNLQDSWAHEHRFRAANGEYLDIFSRGYALRDTQGNAVRAIGAMGDVTQARRVEESLRWAAYHDPLTELPNRKFAAEELQRALDQAAAQSSCVGVIVLDVDGFKAINDGLGHAAGDTVLRTVAARLHANMPPGAIAARLGGDEFAIILPGLTMDDARAATLGAILDGAGAPVTIGEGAVDLSLSAGAAMWPTDGATAEDVMKSADLALYAAKAEGAGTMRGFRPAMRARMEGRNQMLRDAREALHDNRVIPFYQPKISLASGAVVGFEALLRWHHDCNGLQPPATIRAAFEDATLSTRLTDRMIDRVVFDMVAWRDQGFEFGHIAINGSPVDFRRDDFADRILTRLHKAGLPPSMLELEVTETVLLGQFADSVERALCTLRNEGVGIALDDFGTGFASLTHLRQFPVSVLKIDKSFISSLDQTDNADHAIVHGVIDIARRMKIQTVAEGIETPEQARNLCHLGCDIGQGYLFSRAIAAARVPSFLDTQVRGYAILEKNGVEPKSSSALH